MVNKLQKRNPSTERVPTDGSDTDTMQAKRERSRLSGIFGRKKDKTSSSPQSTNASSDLLAPSSTTATNPSADLTAPNTNTSANYETGNSSSTVPTAVSPMSGPVHDSAYASSDAPSNSRSEKSNNIVPLQNEGQIEGVNKDRNLAVNKTTGAVLDEDTGEVVSTVTTTTTTTTTTTLVRGKDGKKEIKTEVNTLPAGSSTTAAAAPPSERSESRPREASVVSEMPANPAPTRSSTDVPPALPSSTTATRANTPPAPTPLQISKQSLPPSAPNLPTRSPKRLSREFDRPPLETVEPLPSSPVAGATSGATLPHPSKPLAPSPAPAAPASAPPAPPFLQDAQRHSPSSGWKAWAQGQQQSGTQGEAQQGTPAPFPPPPRSPSAVTSYPHGPEDYPNYTTSSSAGPGNASHLAPNAAMLHPAGNPHDSYGYTPGPPSSYGGLSTIESMSEESSIAPSASASQAPSAAPSAAATTSTLGSLRAAAKGIHVSPLSIFLSPYLPLPLSLFLQTKTSNSYFFHRASAKPSEALSTTKSTRDSLVKTPKRQRLQMPRIRLLSSVEKVKWRVCNLGRMFRDLVVVVVVQMVLLLLLLWEDGVGEQENIVFRENLYRET